MPGFDAIGRLSIAQLPGPPPAAQPRVPHVTKLPGRTFAPVPQQSYNSCLYSTVASPFYQVDVFPVRRPFVSPLPDPPLNINLFTNPFPFNQYDYLKTFAAPRTTTASPDALNINLFTNPFPVLNLDPLRSLRLPNIPVQDQSYNQNLYSVTVTALPFSQAVVPPVFPVPSAPIEFYNLVLINLNTPLNTYDFSVPVRQRPLPNQDQQFNPNLFTNLIPIFNPYDFLASYCAVKQITIPDQQFNPNLFTNPIPILNIDTSGAKFLRSVVDASQLYNQNLYQVTVTALPFNTYDFSTTNRQRVLPQPDQQLNPNLFTNPFPILNLDTIGAKFPRLVIDTSQPYNSNLYGIVSIPFNQTDWSIPFRPVRFSSLDVQFNPNLFTNSIPFNQFDFSPAHYIPVARYDLSVPVNLNIFTNPVPIFNYIYTPQHPPILTPLDRSIGFQILNAPVVAVTLIQRTLTGVGL